MVPAWLAKERTKWRHETPPGAKALIVEESTPEPEPETPRTPKKKTKGTSSQGASPQSKRKQAASASTSSPKSPRKFDAEIHERFEGVYVSPKKVMKMYEDFTKVVSPNGLLPIPEATDEEAYEYLRDSFQAAELSLAAKPADAKKTVKSNKKDAVLAICRRSQHIHNAEEDCTECSSRGLPCYAQDGQSCIRCQVLNKRKKCSHHLATQQAVEEARAEKSKRFMDFYANLLVLQTQMELVGAARSRESYESVNGQFLQLRVTFHQLCRSEGLQITDADLAARRSEVSNMDRLGVGEFECRTTEY